LADIFELVLDYFQPIELFRFTSDGQLEISVGNLSKAFIFVPFVIGYLLFLLAALASAKTPEDARGMLLAFVGIPLLFGVCFPQVFAIAMTNIFLLFGWLVGLPVVVFGGVDLGVSCSRNMKLAFTLFAIAVLFVIVFRSHPISLFVAFWLRLIAIVVGAWHVAEWMYRSDADNRFYRE
jgi:hypothetical protein